MGSLPCQVLKVVPSDDVASPYPYPHAQSALSSAGTPNLKMSISFNPPIGLKRRFDRNDTRARNFKMM